MRTDARTARRCLRTIAGQKANRVGIFTTWSPRGPTPELGVILVRARIDTPSKLHIEIHGLVPRHCHRLDLDQQILEGEAGDPDAGRARARVGIELALDRGDGRRRLGDLRPVAWRVIVDVELGDVALVEAAFGQP